MRTGRTMASGVCSLLFAPCRCTAGAVYSLLVAPYRCAARVVYSPLVAPCRCAAGVVYSLLIASCKCATGVALCGGVGFLALSFLGTSLPLVSDVDAPNFGRSIVWMSVVHQTKAWEEWYGEHASSPPPPDFL